MPFDPASVILVVLAIGLAIALLFERRSRRSLSYLCGPKPPSRFLGNEMQITRQDQVGDLDFVWIREYGYTWRTKGCLWKEYLMTVDPKALQYIFHTSGYNYPKSVEATQTMRILVDRGISWANGDIHRRQRKVMNPAFSPAQLRAYLPIIQRHGSKITQRWKDQLTLDGQASAKTFNIAHWLSRAALDITGETAFNYSFNAMENSEGELLKCFDNLFADSMLYPPTWEFLFRFSWPYIPEWLLYYVKYLPTREYRRFRHFVDTAKRIGKELLVNTDKTFEQGSKDVMRILIESNNAEDPRRRLSDDEVYSQMANLILAGYETAASSLSWLLLELSQRPEQQARIREEISATRARRTGSQGLTISDYDSMAYMNNVIKEALRLHPIVPTLTRVALVDDVIPLSKPVISKRGKVITEVPINKGQEIVVSICGYNRLKDVWGKDADQWNPDRWLDTKTAIQTNVGTYANLMTFAAGVRGCIGWRLALLEMQTMLVELLENFHFELPEGVEIQRVPTKLMIPMVRGKMMEGTQLPLKVSIAQ